MAYEDLLKDTSSISDDGNFFVITVTDLDPDESYPIQLRWKYSDGTFSQWSAVKTLPVVNSIEPPSVPSTPTVKSVLGAIQISWDGKGVDGNNMPNQSDYAKIYVGTTENFTPEDSGANANYVDRLDFANKQNTVNIGVKYKVNDSLTINYGIDYYVKIKAFNVNNQSSTVVTALNTSSPRTANIRVGTVSKDGIVSISADQIETGTLSAGSQITVGADTGSHVLLSGTGSPIVIYGSDGSTEVLKFDTSNNLNITGTIYAEDGYFGKTGFPMKIGYKVNSITVDEQTTNYDGIYMGAGNYWYSNGSFEVGNGTAQDDATQYFRVNNGAVEVSGTLIAGNWTIYNNEISNNSLDGAVSINFGSAEITQPEGAGGFYISSFGENIFSVEELSEKVLLGSSVRKVEAVTSASVSTSNGSSSRGVRNMYTTTDTYFASHTSVYLNETQATDGDILLVYTA